MNNILEIDNMYRSKRKLASEKSLAIIGNLEVNCLFLFLQ